MHMIFNILVNCLVFQGWLGRNVLALHFSAD